MFVHNLNPVIATLGPFEIRWYGLMYVIGFILAYFILKHLSKQGRIKLTKEQLEDMLVYGGIGGILGARLFYVLVYNLTSYLQNPAEIIAVWHGGLSFHGSVIGGLIGLYLFSRKYKFDFLEILDISSIPFVLGLALGRIGNFINGELYGRVTDVSWCVQFPGAEGCRHPSQLYASVKDLLIFATLWVLKDKTRSKSKTSLDPVERGSTWEMKKGMLAATFILMYSVLRFIVEFFREPDPQLGFLAFGLSMGQLLSVLMFIFGVFLFIKINKNIKQ